MKLKVSLTFFAGFAACAALLFLTAATRSPTKGVPESEQDVYYPGTDEAVWPSPALKKKNAPDTSKAIAFSDFTRSGAMGLPEVVGPIFDEINEKYGTDVKPLFK